MRKWRWEDRSKVKKKKKERRNNTWYQVACDEWEG